MPQGRVDIERETRILYVAVDGFAAVRFRSDLFRTLVRRGARVTVTSAALGEEHRAALERLGTEVRSFPLERTGLNPLADGRTKSALRDLMMEIRPDVVIARAAKPVAYALPVAKELGIARRIGFMTGLGTMFHPNSAFERMTALLGRRVITRGLRSATDIWVLNPDNAAMLHSPSFGLRQVPITDMDSDGIDLDAYRPSPLPDTPTFCFVGRLLPAKGARAFLDAARAMKGSGLRFIVAGETDQHRAAISENEVRELERTGALEYRGFVDDLAGLLEECTALVLPSHHEGRSRSVLEALACGRPVIVSDGPGCRDAIRDGEQGLVVPLGDHHALCEAMKRLAGDPDRARVMGEAARTLAVDRYGQAEVTRRFAEDLLGPGSSESGSGT